MQSAIFYTILGISLILVTAIIVFHRQVDKYLQLWVLRLMGIRRTNDGRYRNYRNGTYVAKDTAQSIEYLTYRIFWHLIAPAIASIPILYVGYIYYLQL